MVLAEHRTPIRGRLVATTVETVRFTRPWWGAGVARRWEQVVAASFHAVQAEAERRSRQALGD